MSNTSTEYRGQSTLYKDCGYRRLDVAYTYQCHTEDGRYNGIGQHRPGSGCMCIDMMRDVPHSATSKKWPASDGHIGTWH